MTSLYQDLYDLVANLVYGGTLDGYAEYVCTLICTCAVLFLVSLPFLIVWKVIRMICG